MKDTVSRSWFAVFPYPEQHGYTGTPQEIIEKLKNEWVQDNPLKKGYWAYCISDKRMPHIHMILEASGAMRFTAVKKAYTQAHLEPTKGNKKQVMAYINKEPPFDEKGEEVIASISHGNIEGRKLYSLSDTDAVLYTIEQLVEEGKTPAQIMAEDIKLRKEESIIRKCYFAKRYRETPPHRDIKVTWHLGDSGSGKSYTYVKLCEQYGDDNVYFFSDYANKGVGGFDGYCGESVLFMDELKGNSLPFEMLLTITHGYRTQIHCRYSNCYALWDEIHITSILSPEDIYKETVSRELQDKDTIKQLLRRVTQFVYHYIEDGVYKEFCLEGSKYKSYEDLKYLATGGWSKVDEAELPFE